MTNKIKHRGIVENIHDSHVQVRIIQTSACSSCSIKGHCTSADSKEKLIDIFDINTSEYKVGQEVWVYATTSMGFYAVLLAFILPFILLVATLFILMDLTQGDELFSALCALTMLFPYYLIIYFFRNKLSKKFAFSIEPIEN